MLLAAILIVAVSGNTETVLRVGHFHNLSRQGKGWFEEKLGLGIRIEYGREFNAMEQVIGVMLVIITIALLADKILFSPFERFLHSCWGTGLR
jgi:hypothetical protein